MTTMTSYANGVPSWVDLATPDLGAAKEFYATLFGWDYDDQPTDGPGDYTMARRNGQNAAGMMPAGAVICLWEAREHIGADIVNEHGAFSWCELITPDPEAVTTFYRAVFGWTTQTAPMPTATYTLFNVVGGNENGIAGAMAPPVEGMPSYWGVYFMVNDAARAVETARTQGAQVMMEATEMPGVGVLATLVDPHGAAFSVMEPGQ